MLKQHTCQSSEGFAAPGVWSIYKDVRDPRWEEGHGLGFAECEGSWEIPDYIRNESLILGDKRAL